MNRLIGQRIKEERTLLGLTQEKLAEKINSKFNIKINKGMISKWENSREEPSLPNIRFLSSFFQVSMSYIVGDSTVKDPLLNIRSFIQENKKIMAINIKRYMNLYQIDRNKICDDLGIKYSTFSDWVNAKTYPRIDKIELIANYFGVTKADLIEEYALKLEEKKELQYNNFITAEDAMKFVLEQEVVMGSGGFDSNSLSDEEKVEFANALLEHLKLLGLKYKK